MRKIEVEVHEIAVDGLPPRFSVEEVDTDTGRIAFLFDGCVVSGWPLYSGEDADGPDFIGRWEADGDVGRHQPFHGVTHWVRFPRPLIELERGA